MMAFGIAQIPNAKVDVFPEFAPPRVEIQTIALGQLLERGRGAHHRPDRGAAQRAARPRRAALEVGRAALLDPAHLRARHRRADGAPARAGAARAGHAHAADLGEPAVHDAAAVGDQPDHEDRALLGRAEPDRDVVDRLLEDQPAAAARARRRAGGHLRRAARSSATCRSTRRSWPRNGVSLERVMEATRRRRSTPGCCSTPRAARRRHRRLRRGGRPAAERPPRAADRRARASSAEVPVVERERQDAAAGRPRPRASRTTSRCGATRVINDGPGLLLIVQKFRGANTMEVTRGVEEAIDEMRPGPPGHRDRHDDLPAGDVHRAVDRQPHDGAADRRRARGPDHRRVPVRVAHGVHQPDRDPAVADRGDRSCSTCAARRST